MYKMFLMSTIIVNIHNPLLGIIYAFWNILTLTFLSWLYKETWSDKVNKMFKKKINIVNLFLWF